MGKNKKKTSLFFAFNHSICIGREKNCSSWLKTKLRLKYDFSSSSHPILYLASIKNHGVLSVFVSSLHYIHFFVCKH